MSETPITLVATCAFGLESIVRRELHSLGYEGRVVSPGRVRFDGDLSAIVRTNLWLRCADRVLIELASFNARDFDALFDTTRELSWEQWLPRDASFPVNGKSLKSQLSSVPAVQRAVKKAIVMRLQTAYDTSLLSESGPLYKIEIALLNDEATLTIDTTGPSLHKRGYRTRFGGAPIKETLAAALVMLSFWKGDRPLIDPFCGSGTIPIEAAMFARGLPPGRNREFSFFQWPQLSKALWDEAVANAEAQASSEISDPIRGTDVDELTLRAARQNAAAAGVEDWIHFQAADFSDLQSSRKYGCVITNPPYGQRLGEHDELIPLYESMPVVLSRLPTWSHYVLTAYPKFEGLIGRKADRRRKLYNGRIECTYYQFHGPRKPRDGDESVSQVGESDVSASNSNPGIGDATKAESPWKVDPNHLPAVFGGVTEKGKEQAELFRRRLTKRAKHLRRYPTRQGISCYRLYERDIPEIPLAVDRYEDHLHIVEYERPHERTLSEHASWLDLMAETARDTLEIEKGKTFLKRKGRQVGKTQHEAVADDGYEIRVGEGGLEFIVNLSDYMDTGLFLDHRITRNMVREEAAGTRFLNLFAYTGSFSVYAADGGATETTTVDWSSTYLEWARRNMRTNGHTGKQHRFVREGSMDFLVATPRQPTWDLAVVDPPTFSNSKRTEEVWDVQKSYIRLFEELLPRMEPGGVVYFSTNFRRFKFDPEKVPVNSYREISKQTVPPEYRNERIHRCWRLVV